MLIEAFHDGVLVIEDTKIIKVNQSFYRITGLKKDLIENKDLRDFYNSPHVCLRSVFEVYNLVNKLKKTVTILRKMTQGNEIFISANPLMEGQKIKKLIVNIRDVTELKHLVEQVSQLSELYISATQEDIKYQLLTDGIVAESMAMRKIIELITRIAKVDSVVLLQGESGTGKEVLARLIHKMSDRSHKPFVSINCAAIPESLLESELFGYEKGAFSGALKDGKPGLFETANGGTVFLDEISEMPLNLQAKLLRFLQDQELYRLGGVRPISLDIRIIAATNKNLEHLVKQGSFREDLFYRLDVVPIHLPPLRERREDIFPLAWRFLQHFNQRYKQNKTLSETLINALEAYDWPGNVRELKNIIERLVVTSDSNILRAEDLPRDIITVNNVESTNTILLPKGKIPSLKKTKEDAEKTLLMEAFSRGKTTREIGSILGVHHTTVVRKLRKYGIRQLHKENNS